MYIDRRAVIINIIYYFQRNLVYSYEYSYNCIYFSDNSGFVDHVTFFLSYDSFIFKLFFIYFYNIYLWLCNRQVNYSVWVCKCEGVRVEGALEKICLNIFISIILLFIHFSNTYLHVFIYIYNILFI